MNKNICNSLLKLIVIGSFLSISAGGVETATYCDILELNGSSWEGNHTLPLFDSNLGNLVGVDLAIDLSVLQNFSLENEGNESQIDDAESEVLLSITMPNTSSISVNASNTVSEKLAAYDGETDFAGSSGKTIRKTESKGMAEEKYSDLSNFVGSSQNETVSFPAAISIRSETSGNIVFSLSTLAESKICVTYTYEPSGSN